jgi:hypothetical protein
MIGRIVIFDSENDHPRMALNFLVATCRDWTTPVLYEHSAPVLKKRTYRTPWK